VAYAGDATSQPSNEVSVYPRPSITLVGNSEQGTRLLTGLNFDANVKVYVDSGPGFVQLPPGDVNRISCTEIRITDVPLLRVQVANVALPLGSGEPKVIFSQPWPGPKQIIVPIYKGVVAEIKAAGMKRAMTFARVLVDALAVRIDDNVLTKPELRSLGKMTKAEAQTLAAGLIEDGLKVSGGAADALIVAAVKARNQGIASDQMGIKPEDEDPEDE
jgi:hypothetical protein